jgi:hypothetical protein
MTKDIKLIEVAAEIKIETEKAFLVFDGKKEEWIPKSQVEYDQRDGVFTMPEWLAKAKGFI